MLDSWIATLTAQQEKELQKAVENRTTTLGEDNDQIMPLNFVLSKDIIEALYYPTQPVKPPMDAPSIVPGEKDPSQSTAPQSSVIAIHAPKDGVVAVSSQPNQKKYRLNIAEKTDLQKLRDELKRKAEEENQDPYLWNTKRQRLNAPATSNGEGGPIQVYLMPVEYNSKLEKMISAGAKLLPTSHDSGSEKAAASGEDAAAGEGDEKMTEAQDEEDPFEPTLKANEGIADFFT